MDTCKHKTIALVVGTLAFFGLLSGLASIIAEHAVIGNISYDELIFSQGVQIVISLMSIVGCFLLYKENNSGRYILLLISSLLIIMAASDALIYFIDNRDLAYMFASIIFYIVPLVVLFIILSKLSQR